MKSHSNWVINILRKNCKFDKKYTLPKQTPPFTTNQFSDFPITSHVNETRIFTIKIHSNEGNVCIYTLKHNSAYRNKYLKYSVLFDWLSSIQTHASCVWLTALTADLTVKCILVYRFHGIKGTLLQKEYKLLYDLKYWRSFRGHTSLL